MAGMLIAEAGVLTSKPPSGSSGGLSVDLSKNGLPKFGSALIERLRPAVAANESLGAGQTKAEEMAPKAAGRKFEAAEEATWRKSLKNKDEPHASDQGPTLLNPNITAQLATAPSDFAVNALADSFARAGGSRSEEGPSKKIDSAVAATGAEQQIPTAKSWAGPMTFAVPASASTVAEAGAVQPPKEVRLAAHTKDHASLPLETAALVTPPAGTGVAGLETGLAATSSREAASVARADRTPQDLSGAKRAISFEGGSKPSSLGQSGESLPAPVMEVEAQFPSALAPGASAAGLPDVSTNAQKQSAIGAGGGEGWNSGQPEMNGSPSIMASARSAPVALTDPAPIDSTVGAGWSSPAPPVPSSTLMGGNSAKDSVKDLGKRPAIGGRSGAILDGSGLAGAVRKAAAAPSQAGFAASGSPHSFIVAQGGIAAESGAASGMGVDGRGSRAGRLPADPLSRMDVAGVASPPAWHGSSRTVEVGIDDPAHGWIEVKAQGVSGQVTASLTAASPEAHAALRAQLPGMAEYLAEREIGVRGLAVGVGSGEPGTHSGGSAGNFTGNSDPNMGQGSGQSSDQDSARRAGQSLGWEPARVRDARGNAEFSPAGLALDGTGSGGDRAGASHLISVRV